MNDQVGKTLDTLTSESASALRNGEYTVAIRVASEIIRRQPNHAEAHAVQFSALLKEKKFEKARSIGTLTAKLNPKSLFILNNQARLQLEAKQPAAAVGLLKSLIDQCGERSHGLYNLALAQRMIANYDYSISMFRRTLDHQPEHELAASQLADCLRAAGKQEEAVSAYNYVRLLRNKHAPSHSHYIHSAVINNSITPADLKNELNLWQDRKRIVNDTLPGVFARCYCHPFFRGQSNDTKNTGRVVRINRAAKRERFDCGRVLPSQRS